MFYDNVSKINQGSLIPEMIQGCDYDILIVLVDHSENLWKRGIPLEYDLLE